MIKKVFEAVLSYFVKEHELNITLFKILGITGVIVSIVAGIESAIAGGTAKNGALIDFLAAIMAMLLLWFVEQSGKYVIGYLVTVVTVFMGLFTVLFFKGGGMEGSIPYFFVFGLVFSFMMFEGALLAVVGIVEMLYYTFICIFSVLHPEYVTPFESVNAEFVDKMTGLIMVGLALGFMFLIYIGEYKKQQKIAEEANQAKSLFLANISHDIRSPINMMINMNKMVIRESENELVKEYASNAYDAGNQLMFMVNQLLDLSRLEKGSEELSEIDYDFYKTIDNLADYYKEEAEKKNLRFVVSIDKNIAKYLHGDIRKITRIINNLCTNAIKYTVKGQVRLNIVSLGTSEKHQTIRFEISDTGIGINEDDLNKIFKSFERIESAAVSNIEGTGLGLAIAADIAKLLNSSIEVKSEYGKGSTFAFNLVQGIGNASNIVSEGENGSISFIAPDAKILVVDDNSMNLYVMKALLKRTLIEVDTAESADECLNKCKNKKYDLIFMDYMMPVVDGIGALKQLKKEENKNADTKVYVLTADVSPGTKEMLLSNGFTGYLSKPVDGEYMENIIRSNLPEEYIQLGEDSDKSILSDEEKDTYSRLLAEYDVIFEEGLRFVSYDISQYARVCSYFLKSVEAGIQDLNSFAAKNDWEKVAAKCHSLKGNARNVGSVELYAVAKNLEKHAKANDKDYVLGAITLLNLEWTRTQSGLLEFLKMYERNHPKEESTLDEASYSKEESLKLLKEYISQCKQSPSLNLIKIIKSNENDETVIDILTRIEAALSEIEFDEAETLLELIDGQ